MKIDIRAWCNFILLNNGAGVNLCNKIGFSPLHAEFENGHASNYWTKVLRWMYDKDERSPLYISKCKWTLQHCNFLTWQWCKGKFTQIVKIDMKGHSLNQNSIHPTLFLYQFWYSWMYINININILFNRCILKLQFNLHRQDKCS